MSALKCSSTPHLKVLIYPTFESTDLHNFATKLFCSAENIFNLCKAILNGILNHAEITPISACKFLQIYAIEKLMKLIQWSWNPRQWNLSPQKFLIVKLVNQNSPWIVILARLRTKRNSVCWNLRFMLSINCTCVAHSYSSIIHLLCLHTIRTLALLVTHPSYVTNAVY
ncbi:hypothetical protein CPB83DRAFT_416956 [Crepidotus variabilis]|uniref:Uncharacterized protein n=1 Tax=Crepidotus variabilis TaxID=179855 RepID=A0A9P6ERR0_9AGAR|nr:hypothetical protein CPB83DRAFT_416956 [Crepidotus variabilis]